jgi:hypothetical protein
MRKLTNLPESYLPFLVIGAFLIPIKLSFAYCLFIPLILSYSYARYKEKKLTSFIFHHLNTPLLIFLSLACATSVLGLNPFKSIPTLLSAMAMTLIAPLYSSISNQRNICLTLGGLIAGQTIAALHSIGTRIITNFPQGFFVGEVTESGQIGLTLLACLGLIHYIEEDPILEKSPKRSAIVLKLFGILITILMLLNCFAGSLNIAPLIVNFLLLSTTTVAIGVLFYALFSIKKSPFQVNSYLPLLITFSLPILTTTLIINLKRGPWAGVLCGLTIYLTAFRPKIIIPLFATVLLISTTLAPVRERLITAQEHFFISGGRSEIWDIGKEMIQTYPLGIGFKNSPILQKFSNEIPTNLRHFHSNPINIAVETGLLGLALFLWWIFTILKTAKNLPTRDYRFHPLAIAIGAAIVSWQTAGLVEYNFGDAEVLYVAYILVGLLGALTNCVTQESNLVQLQSIHKNK